MRTALLIMMICVAFSLKSKAQNIFETELLPAENPFNVALAGDFNSSLLGDTGDLAKVSVSYFNNPLRERESQNITDVNASFKIRGRNWHNNYLGIGVSSSEQFKPESGDKLIISTLSAAFHHKIGKKNWQLSEGLQIFTGLENHQILNGWEVTDVSHYNHFLYYAFPQIGFCFSKSFKHSTIYMGAYSFTPPIVYNAFYVKYYPTPQAYFMYKLNLGKHIIVYPELSFTPFELSENYSSSFNCKMQEAYSFHRMINNKVISIFACQYINSASYGLYGVYVNQNYEWGMAYNGLQLSFCKSILYDEYIGISHSSGISLKWNWKARPTSN